MKYKNLMDKIDLLTKEAETSIELSKKRQESIDKLKKMVKENNLIIKDIQEGYERKYFYFKDSVVNLQAQLKKVESEKKEYIVKYREAEDYFDELFISKKNEYAICKQKLNDHFYVLQKAFNDYVKTKTKPEMPDYIKLFDERIKSLEEKILNMFFEGDNIE
jgi:hypothetical protein